MNDRNIKIGTLNFIQSSYTKNNNAVFRMDPTRSGKLIFTLYPRKPAFSWKKVEIDNEKVVFKESLINWYQ